jgi:Tfp pilus assembly protein PilX
MPEIRPPRGNCLITILLILVFMAAFGIISWDAVGAFARFIVYVVVAGIAIIVGILLYAWFFGNRW